MLNDKFRKVLFGGVHVLTLTGLVTTPILETIVLAQNQSQVMAATINTNSPVYKKTAAYFNSYYINGVKEDYGSYHKVREDNEILKRMQRWGAFLYELRSRITYDEVNTPEKRKAFKAQLSGYLEGKVIPFILTMRKKAKNNPKYVYPKGHRWCGGECTLFHNSNNKYTTVDKAVEAQVVFLRAYTEMMAESIIYLAKYHQPDKPLTEKENLQAQEALLPFITKFQKLSINYQVHELLLASAAFERAENIYSLGFITMALKPMIRRVNGFKDFIGMTNFSDPNLAPPEPSYGKHGMGLEDIILSNAYGTVQKKAEKIINSHYKKTAIPMIISGVFQAEKNLNDKGLFWEDDALVVLAGGLDFFFDIMPDAPITTRAADILDSLPKKKLSQITQAAAERMGTNSKRVNRAVASKGNGSRTRIASNADNANVSGGSKKPRSGNAKKPNVEVEAPSGNRKKPTVEEPNNGRTNNRRGNGSTDEANNSRNRNRSGDADGQNNNRRRSNQSDEEVNNRRRNQADSEVDTSTSQKKRENGYEVENTCKEVNGNIASSSRFRGGLGSYGRTLAFINPSNTLLNFGGFFKKEEQLIAASGCTYVSGKNKKGEWEQKKISDAEKSALVEKGGEFYYFETKIEDSIRNPGEKVELISNMRRDLDGKTLKGAYQRTIREAREILGIDLKNFDFSVNNAKNVPHEFEIITTNRDWKYTLKKEFEDGINYTITKIENTRFPSMKIETKQRGGFGRISHHPDGHTYASTDANARKPHFNVNLEYNTLQKALQEAGLSVNLLANPLGDPNRPMQREYKVEEHIFYQD